MNGDFVPGTDGIVDGHHCPTCGQKVKLYPRHLYHVPARMLIAMYNTDPYGWIYIPKLYKAIEIGGGDTTKPRYWRMMQPQPGERNDGSTRTGMWRLTARGRRWVTGRSCVRYTALIYNDTLWDFAGPWWSIWQALGKGFDYNELMYG